MQKVKNSAQVSSLKRAQISSQNPKFSSSNLKIKLCEFDENPKLSGAYLDFFKEAKKHFKGRIFGDFLRRFAYGIDASCYRYIPKIVIWAKNEAEIVRLFALSRKFKVPLCFRAAGTSLSGQASCGGVLVLCNEFWKEIWLNFTNASLRKNSQNEISCNADLLNLTNAPSSIYLSCGVIGADANAALKPFGRKIGPDPATINNALIGGIFSNNSSGMCCGVKQNSYQTIKSVRVILQDGFILDTKAPKNAPQSVENFAKTHPKIVQKLLNLREEILADEKLSSLIKRKFAIKNTTGYSLNALLDFADLKDILNHIFVGAEGTLGFISRVEYECVKDFKHKACALVFYENLSIASEAVKILAKNENIVSAAEIMDFACLKKAASLDGMPDEISRISGENCAILIQLESNDLENLSENLKTIKVALSPIKSLFGVNFSFDEKEQNSWWKIRKALLPLAASTRESGATVITEDICFEIEHFGEGMKKTSELFAKHGYTGIIFGHALSSNVHFIITPLLKNEAEIVRFGAFMEDLAKMVAKFQGSTKAEHGTGRMVAPFVELEWGKKAYAINREIKDIFDPARLINPDVIISSDKQIHLKALKPASQRLLEDYLDACMECGFCEKICPSKNLSLTPRQRIGVLREIKRLESIENLSKNQKVQLRALKNGYKALAIDTCATCSMCATLCPLEIDTAKIALKFNENSHKNTLGEKMAHFLTKDLNKTIKAAKFGVKSLNLAQKALGKHTANAASKALRKILKTPILPRFMPRANELNLHSKICENKNGELVYFSSCLNQIFAEKEPINSSFERLCEKAKFSVIYPQNASLCCGKAFKNYESVSKEVAKKAYFELLKASKNGQIPIVCDHSACSLELLKRVRKFEAENLALNLAENLSEKLAGILSENSHEILSENSRKNTENSHIKTLQIYDMPKFIYKFLTPFLKITKKHEKIAIYAPCGTRNLAVAKSGWESDLIALARLCADKIIIDDNVKCCGFAGNKGFVEPELNESALKYFGVDFVKNSCENLSENLAENSSENLSENLAENSCENLSENLAENSSENLSENLGENSQNLALNLSENGKNLRENSLENSSKNLNANLSEISAKNASKFSEISRGFSSSSTCEIGLSERTNFKWQHIVYLVDECVL